MISNVNLNASAHVQNAAKVPDEKLQSKVNPAVEVTPVKNEANETAIVDVFTVSFWDRGVPPAEDSSVIINEAAKSVDITVNTEI